MTRRDFEHRRRWVTDRIQELADLFAVDVYAYAVMSNHLHIVLGTDPSRVAGWADTEVARRWLMLFPGPGGRRGQAPEESAILALCGEPGRLEECRSRLADVSWFMRCLNEPIARRANREDECTGRFWEGRFKCQRIGDAGALLTCMAYVDLNPVRAKMAATPEASDFTSAQDRSVAFQARRQVAAAAALNSSMATPDQPVLDQASRNRNRDRWLVPFGSSGDVSQGAARVSWLDGLREEDYLNLLDWTGRGIRAGKRGHIADNLKPVLQRLDLDVESWTENVERYGSLFHRLAGKVGALRDWARAKGRAWLQGHEGARRLYSEAA